MRERTSRPKSLTIGAIIFFVIGTTELLGGGLLLTSPIETNRGVGALTLLLGFADFAGGYGLWRREVFLGLVLCVLGIFAEGAEMLFMPLLIGAGFIAIGYILSVLAGYVIILVIIGVNWRALLKVYDDQPV
ncbi:MAG: hypothetical protein QXJ75_06500 [Candidatus Bathyarchaeia archaeon]